MPLRPIWWWFWLGWFPLFWFYPSYINAPIKTKKANGDHSVSYYSGVGSIAAWVFFVLFLILFLSVATYSTLWLWLWIVCLIGIFAFWCVGLLHFYFYVEFEDQQTILEEDENDISNVQGGNKKTDDEELQPMRMRSSRQMKSLNMQL